MSFTVRVVYVYDVSIYCCKIMSNVYKIVQILICNHQLSGTYIQIYLSMALNEIQHPLINNCSPLKTSHTITYYYNKTYKNCYLPWSKSVPLNQPIIIRFYLWKLMPRMVNIKLHLQYQEKLEKQFYFIFFCQ